MSVPNIPTNTSNNPPPEIVGYNSNMTNNNMAPNNIYPYNQYQYQNSNYPPNNNIK